ncbi:MAG: 23S rRNA (pseudouridine(1915)-N(3))-methyltransferase RlmH [Oscillospiraceae bacterium]
MQKVSILCVGRLKEKFYIEAAAEYEKRLQRHCKLTVTELGEQRLPENPSPAEVRRCLALEAESIRQKLPKGGAVIALCVEGGPLTSPQFAEKLRQFALEGRSQLTFLIGGSFGLDETLKREADLRLSFSPMTFPHHLARVMLLEQLYRGYQILEGSAYHK